MTTQAIIIQQKITMATVVNKDEVPATQKRAYIKGKPKKVLKRCHHGKNKIGCRQCSPVQCIYCPKVESYNRIRVHIKAKHVATAKKCECEKTIYFCSSCHSNFFLEPTDPLESVFPSGLLEQIRDGYPLKTTKVGKWYLGNWDTEELVTFTYERLDNYYMKRTGLEYRFDEKKKADALKRVKWEKDAIINKMKVDAENRAKKIREGEMTASTTTDEIIIQSNIDFINSKSKKYLIDYLAKQFGLKFKNANSAKVAIYKGFCIEKFSNKALFQAHWNRTDLDRSVALI